MIFLLLYLLYLLYALPLLKKKELKYAYKYEELYDKSLFEIRQKKNKTVVNLVFRAPHAGNFLEYLEVTV
jgi:hypothetical protein